MLMRRCKSVTRHRFIVARINYADHSSGRVPGSGLVHPRNRPSYFEEVHQFSVSHLASCLLE